MNNTITLIIIGAYTLVYLVVFFIQRSQLNAINDVNTSIKAYMDIFKIDEVKKYVELKEENIMMIASKMLTDDKKMKEIATKVITEKADVIAEVYKKQFEGDLHELINCAFKVIISAPADQREGFMNSSFPKTQRYLKTMVKMWEAGLTK